LIVVTDGRADEQTQELILLFEFQLHHAMGIADSGRVVVAVALKAAHFPPFNQMGSSSHPVLAYAVRYWLSGQGCGSEL